MLEIVGELGSVMFTCVGSDFLCNALIPSAPQISRTPIICGCPIQIVHKAVSRRLSKICGVVIRHRTQKLTALDQLVAVPLDLPDSCLKRSRNDMSAELTAHHCRCFQDLLLRW